MSKLWNAVDDYFNSELNADDEVITGILETKEDREAAVAGQGKFMQLLAKIKDAKSILEIGTLGGYSTLWLGKALPEDGRMATLESNSEHAEIAEDHIAAAGLEDKVEIITEPAEESLPKLLERGYPRFDFIYIDANQKLFPDYLEEAIDMAKCGSVIITERKIVEKFDENSVDPEMQRCMEILKNSERVDATAVQTVGSKGHDGFILAVLD
ncbi:O-methyltransferase [Salinicoccus albus]|uniref:O-methyltransferase n=1 Tax=Salinicoccus albus TaxID=418756 RepID=UPI00037940E1|nr:class I SAM-dependent methyltransferase [Salinicoccus albus]